MDSFHATFSVFDSKQLCTQMGNNSVCNQCLSDVFQMTSDISASGNEATGIY